MFTINMYTHFVNKYFIYADKPTTNQRKCFKINDNIKSINSESRLTIKMCNKNYTA